MMDIVELSRRLENIVRIGVVAEVDHARALCRVDSGGLRTDWLPWSARRAGDTRSWCPPTLGEQVLIFSPSGETAGGVVQTGIYSAAHDQPDDDAGTHLVVWPDGTRVEYDHDTHRLRVDCVGDIKIRAAGHIAIEAQGRISLKSGEDIQAQAARDIKIHAQEKMELLSRARLLLRSLAHHVVTKCICGTKVS